MNFKFNIKTLKIEISQKVLNKLPQITQVLDGNERGGILMGKLYFKRNKILITDIVESNSKALGKYNFEMDVEYIQKKITSIWEKSAHTETYLGDWHTHPEYYPKPSLRDYITFSKNFFQSSIDQNFLIYIILGYKKEKNVPTWIGICNGFKTKILI